MILGAGFSGWSAPPRHATMRPDRSDRLTAIMANLVSRRQFTIEWGHCDPAGIVFNPRFFEFFDCGTWGLFEAALGVKPADLVTFGILGMPIVDASARFLSPVRFGDTIEIRSQVSAFRRSSFDVEHQIFVGSVLAVEGQEIRVWSVRDSADPQKIKAQPIPPDVAAKFQAA
jgi:4-hydroxybenzoyl-CoA thioesterase